MKDLENYMLPCLNKKLFGMDCMGCGLQRSFSLLIQGDLAGAFLMYPAIYPLILLFLAVGFNTFKPFKFSNTIITVLAILSVGTIIGSYAVKVLTQ